MINRRRRKTTAGQGAGGSVRIIAGRWRGRRLPVADLPGLRPTSDRARETLFSWLTPHLPGARCLDLFAGTGVLGFEALSRGAKHCVLLDSQAAAISMLQQSAVTLDATELVSVLHADALGWLPRQQDYYDLVFIDPPYGAGIWDEALEKTVLLLKPGSLVYCESPVEVALQTPAQLELFKQKKVASVQMRLFRRAGKL